MSKPRRNSPALPLGDPLFAPKQRKVIPHEFVLDAIAPLLPWTRPMFGCLVVYVEDKIVLILRDKRDETSDNGVWLATTEEYHESLRREFSEYAIHTGTRERRHWLAGPSCRCAGFRGGGAARVRPRCRQGSSNRQGARGAAAFRIKSQEDTEVCYASEGTQERCERSREAVRRWVIGKATGLGRVADYSLRISPEGFHKPVSGQPLGVGGTAAYVCTISSQTDGATHFYVSAFA